MDNLKPEESLETIARQDKTNLVAAGLLITGLAIGAYAIKDLSYTETLNLARQSLTMTTDYKTE
jgi:hypothetical protein